MHDAMMHDARTELLVCFCRLQLPDVALASSACMRHLQRTFDLFRSKHEPDITWEKYLENLYPLDWFLASACLEGNARAWLETKEKEKSKK